MKFISFILFIQFLFAGELKLSSFKIADGFSKPVYICQPPGDNERLFVLEQKGVVKMIKNGSKVRKPFADIRDRVHNPVIPGDERGLLGLAFHPDYQSNGFVFMNYIDEDDHTIISRFIVSENLDKLDTDSEKILMKIKQPFSNHNGGHMVFGPDGYLYISVGDGGKWGDPYNNAQNLETVFGSILRIDVDNGEPYAIPEDNPFLKHENAKKEIWQYGLRNVWRFSFDRESNDLVIGDVGQNLWEEVNWNTWEESKGANYGWRIMEANHCYNPEEFCDTTGLVKPVHEYPNNAAYMKILMGMDEAEATGCSVTGGYVYRGANIPEFKGTYIFGDYCTGRIWSFKLKNGKLANFQNLRSKLKKTSKDVPLFISSFGEDNSGELYVVDYLGAIYKFVPY